MFVFIVILVVLLLISANVGDYTPPKTCKRHKWVRTEGIGLKCEICGQVPFEDLRGSDD